MPASEPASTAMFATASRSSIESVSAPDALEHSVRPAADADHREHSEDHVFTRHEAPGTAIEVDPDRLGDSLPERAERETGGDVGRPEPRPERAEGTIGASVGVAAGDDRPGHDPSLFAQERVLDAAAALAVVR